MWWPEVGKKKPHKKTIESAAVAAWQWEPNCHSAVQAAGAAESGA